MVVFLDAFVVLAVFEGKEPVGCVGVIDGDFVEFFLGVDDELVEGLLGHLEFLYFGGAVKDLNVLSLVETVIMLELNGLELVVAVLVGLLDGEELHLERALLVLELGELFVVDLGLELEVGEQDVLLEELLDDVVGLGLACMVTVPVCDLMKV